MPILGETGALPRAYRKDYFCSAISEDVKIAVKYAFSLSRVTKNKRYVQCDQLECQYFDRHQYPCPLSLDLFSEEIEKPQQKWKGAKIES